MTDLWCWYILTLLGYINEIHNTIYGNIMDSMGIYILLHNYIIFIYFLIIYLLISFLS